MYMELDVRGRIKSAYSGLALISRNGMGPTTKVPNPTVLLLSDRASTQYGRYRAGPLDGKGTVDWGILCVQAAGLLVGCNFGVAERLPVKYQ
jgi:hypothetical protein